MAKPRKHHNRPKISEGTREGVTEEGGEGEAVEAEEEGRRGKQGEKTEDPLTVEEPTDKRRAMRPLEAEKRRRGGREETQGGRGQVRRYPIWALVEITCVGEDGCPSEE